MTKISVGGGPSEKISYIIGHFGKFYVLKVVFLVWKSCKVPRSWEEDYWVPCTHFWHLSPGVRPFLKISPKYAKMRINRVFLVIQGDICSRGGPPGEKINFVNVPIDLMYFKKKGGIDIITFGEKVFIFGKNPCEGPDLK